MKNVQIGIWEIVSSYSSATAPDFHGISRFGLHNFDCSQRTAAKVAALLKPCKKKTLSTKTGFGYFAEWAVRFGGLQRPVEGLQRLKRTCYNHHVSTPLSTLNANSTTL